MLGEPLETFKWNKVSVLATALLGGAVVFRLLSAHGAGHATRFDYLMAAVLTALFVPIFVVGLDARPLPVAVGIGAAFALVSPSNNTRMDPFGTAAFFVLICVWLLSVRITLHMDGISYRSLVGSKEFRWDEISRVYLTAVKRGIYFIPLGTYYWFKLIDVRGRKLSFGNRVERPAGLSRKLLEYTYPILFKKAAENFDKGLEVDFGAIHLTRERGLRVRKLFHYREISCNQIANYGVVEGRFNILLVGKKLPVSLYLREVPNAFVLVGLLDAIRQRGSSPLAA